MKSTLHRLAGFVKFEPWEITCKSKKNAMMMTFIRRDGIKL
jgi:hypothetical protein